MFPDSFISCHLILHEKLLPSIQTAGVIMKYKETIETS